MVRRPLGHEATRSAQAVQIVGNWTLFEPWHLWLALAIVLFILEMMTSGFYLACLGFGAMVSALFAMLHFGFRVQFAAFSVAALMGLFALRPLFLRFMGNKKPLARTNAEALVGKKGLVTQRIVPAQDQGRASIEGEDWWVTAGDGAPIEEGQWVIVLKVDSSKLIVERL